MFLAYTDNHRVTIPRLDDNNVALDWNGFECYEYKWQYSSTGLYCSGGNNTAFYLIWQASNYTSIYGFLSQKSTELTFLLPNATSIALAAPSLNVSADMVLYDNGSMYGYGSLFADGGAKLECNGYPYGPAWTSDVTNDASDTAYNLSQVDDKALCLQSHEVRYQ